MFGVAGKKLVAEGRIATHLFASMGERERARLEIILFTRDT